MFYIKQELPINGQIRAKDVQLISDSGEKMGIVPLSRALELAGERKLDLVLVSPNSEIPVCKIMNYGKYKFEQAKREKESRKNQKAVETKEIRVTPNIGDHDFSFKCKNARGFLESGNKVKFTVRFRGRELNNVKIGEEVLKKFEEELHLLEKKNKINNILNEEKISSNEKLESIRKVINDGI